jgi:hypothetical protein
MGRADYLSLGDWNAACFQCGRKRKASTMKKHWQGYYVCPEHWEPRHPQDFVRGVKEVPGVPWSQPAMVQFVYPQNTTSAIAGIAISGLAIAGTGGTLNPPGSTIFIDGQTLIQSSWLNVVNSTTFVDIPAIGAILPFAEADINSIEADGYVTDTRVTNIAFSKFSNKPTTLAGYGIVGGGTLIGIRVFTTADTGSTYVPTSGTNKVVVEVIGGGSAGSSEDSTSAFTSIGSGGSAGTYAIGFFATDFTGVTLTVGAGGVASKVSAGLGAGGVSSFGTLLSCPGGPAIFSRIQTNLGLDFYSGTGSSSVTLTSDATGTKIYSVRGSPGRYGWGSIASGAIGGKGADSKYGRGGMGASAAEGTGGAGLGYGAGGGSSWCANGSTNGYLAGDGAPGVIIVWEYA